MIIELFKKIINDRVFILGTAFLILLLIIIHRLYVLQIVKGEIVSENLNETVRPITITAPRGEIVDKYGVPIATNKSSYVLKIDQNISLSNEDLNETIYNTLILLDENNQDYIYDLPISQTTPYEFTVGESRELRFKKDVGMITPSGLSDDELDEYLLTIDATESLNFLYDKFDIDEKYGDEYRQKIASIRYSMYLQRFSKLYPVPIAYDVNERVIAKIEEESELFPAIVIEIDQIREYPFKEPMAHTLGYTAKITDEEYEEFTELGYDYTLNDYVGRSGIEEYFELDLRGQNGETLVEVTPLGKRMGTVSTTPPIKGNDVILTIDSKLQQDAYEIMERTLKDVIVSKMLTTNSRETPITLNEFFTSFVSANNINFTKLMTAEEGTVSYNISKQIEAEKEVQLANLKTEYENSDWSEEDYEYKIGKITDKSVLTDIVSENRIHYNDLLIMFYEQGIITADETLLSQLRNRTISPLSVVIDKLEKGEITPQMTNLDPSTASVVVVDINTGGIITAVSYPSYDNNYFVNGIDYDYFNKVNFDPTNPIIYRAFSERRAPGSTFKMITAIAGLEEGIITPSTTIYDGVIYKSAGYPYASCWSTVSHGLVNVSQALEVSCNYFFYEVAHRMGLADPTNSYSGIDTLNKYMIAFGLNDPTGAEISEYRDFNDEEYIISSPEYKEYLISKQYAEPTQAQLAWYEGDTIRTAIGQSKNNYTAATMAKYIAMLANGGTRYSLHFLDKIEYPTGEIKDIYEPIVEYTLEMQQSTLDAVYSGMLAVTQGSRGTARTVFRDFPIDVAGKTGTAQESSVRPDHQSFAGFAPYDNPEIAIYVMVPYGTTSSMASPASIIARDVLASYFGLDIEPVQASETNVFVQ